METASQDLAHELTNTVVSLQTTTRDVRRKIEKDQQTSLLDLTQPIGHLLDSIDATHILSLAKPTSETISELDTLDNKLLTFQTTLQKRNQWHPPEIPAPIPCSTDYLDLSDLSTAVRLLGDIIASSNPSAKLTPQAAFKNREWTWDPLWREFYSPSPATDGQPPSTLYLSRWYFDPRTRIWHHANMADSGLLPDEAQQRLGAWEEWTWDERAGEWGLDVSEELEEGVRKEGAKLPMDYVYQNASSSPDYEDLDLSGFDESGLYCCCSPPTHFDTPKGVTLQVDYKWSKFQNIVSEKDGDNLTPIYIQRFKPSKPQLQLEDATTHTQISTGTIHNISIAAECTVHGQQIDIKPLKKWKTAYNYLSTTLSPTSTPIPITWITTSSLKIWDFICIDSTTQAPIAKFSVNWWALKQVGNFHFEQSAAALSNEVRDEVVTVGLTIFYVMYVRMNNPLHLLGAAFAKPGKVEDDARVGGVELAERPDDGTKHKHV
ncbi:hypothetical protein E8E13_003696 [Curvularia kusanoi]|uniref:Uncharacterized protein n=1 Tax=Curvularia kusanoi TaxID=90978 RepID=A0A9P4W672_CURKU|nr:hypothetical protein E8E13_003696 [Curvularia kusanoi]